MKRIAPVVAAVLLLAGCSAAPDAPSDHGSFYAFALSTPGLAGQSHAELDKEASSLCALFDIGPDDGYKLSLMAMKGSGLSDAASALAVTAAVSAYCPDFVDDLPVAAG